MRKKTFKLIFTILILALICWFIKDIFTQSGIEELKGGFIERAQYRNENNTGPIQRVYVVTVKDTTGANLIEYGNLMPHSKYGNTKVYFFKEGNPFPTQLSPGEQNFDQQYNTSYYALYQKGAMGSFSLSKNK